MHFTSAINVTRLQFDYQFTVINTLIKLTDTLPKSYLENTKNMRAVGLQQDVDGMIHTAKTCELERIPSSILKCQSQVQLSLVAIKSEMLCCQKERENLSNSVLNDRLHVKIVEPHLFSA
ncbi:hypothetical protein T07_2922 [Trichinella nelsoni]|uniref:Uncharacterized protein n=1 Tax=Trichinella nelsoni TaxID=6336 RepID=A0A0V0RTS0_9BILA|nr:hypothetical protein T07_2922 [Trichinella nelsoni]